MVVVKLFLKFLNMVDELILFFFFGFGVNIGVVFLVKLIFNFNGIFKLFLVVFYIVW